MEDKITSTCRICRKETIVGEEIYYEYADIAYCEKCFEDVVIPEIYNRARVEG